MNLYIWSNTGLHDIFKKELKKNLSRRKKAKRREGNNAETLWDRLQWATLDHTLSLSDCSDKARWLAFQTTQTPAFKKTDMPYKVPYYMRLRHLISSAPALASGVMNVEESWKSEGDHQAMSVCVLIINVRACFAEGKITRKYVQGI